MTSRKPLDSSSRRAYQPPRLTRVHLVPDEAVLASCKTATTQGPLGASAKCTGTPALCSHSGS
ncbi:MAG TPA: hypothetical protein VFC25_03800 [Verrucomicrobiae bacterium]|nr:hypothetical protein [Verrucomicrobiae bacterium]